MGCAWCKALQQVINSAQNITDTKERRLQRAQRTLKDNTHPGHSMLTLLPSGKRMQKVVLLHHQISERFLSSGYEIIDIIRHTLAF